MMKFVLLVVCILSLISCASIETAPASLDVQAKSFAADTNKATLYVYRNNVVNSAVAMDVLINNQYLGKLRSGHFIKILLKPGRYTVTSRASNDRTIEVNVRAGKVYFVKQEGTFKLFQHGTDLHEVGTAEGKEDVLSCKLVKHTNLSD